MSHDIVNELISLMGQKVLRQILVSIRKNVPSWYAVIADEATDITFKQEFDMSIGYVDEDYETQLACLIFPILKLKLYLLY